MAETKAPNPAPAAPAAPKQLVSPAMKSLYEQVVAEQRRLGWNDAKLCEFATATLGPSDPYKRLKITTLEFLQRLRVPLLERLLAALRGAH